MLSPKSGCSEAWSIAPVAEYRSSPLTELTTILSADGLVTLSWIGPSARLTAGLRCSRTGAGPSARSMVVPGGGLQARSASEPDCSPSDSNVHRSVLRSAAGKDFLFLHLADGGVDDVIDQLPHRIRIVGLGAAGPDQFVLGEGIDVRLHTHHLILLDIAGRVGIAPPRAPIAPHRPVRRRYHVGRARDVGGLLVNRHRTHHHGTVEVLGHDHCLGPLLIPQRLIR